MGKISLTMLFIISCLTSCEDASRSTIDLASVESMQLIYTDDENVEQYLNSDDQALLDKYISSATYDTERNNSGIMLKMVAPEYTVIMKYKEAAKESDWLMIWKSDGRIKFRDKWYVLEPKDCNPLYALLAKYRS